MFEGLLPSGWNETIDETLAYIYDEAVDHVTEHKVNDYLDYELNAINTPVDEWVSKLRARAVVLAAEVERLRCQ